MIRLATVDDLEAIKSINEQCLPENYDLKTYDQFLSIYNMTYVLVCENPQSPTDQKIVGYVIGSIEDSVEAHIVSIAVLPEFRNKGFGQRLILALLVDAKRKGLKSSSLHVRVSNKKAISIYKRLRFQPIREIEKYYSEDGENGFLMRRQL